MDLINLLPKAEQAKRKKEIKRKLLINFYMFFVFIALVLLFYLLLLWGRLYLTLEREKALSSSFANKINQIKVLETEIGKINRLLRQINSFYAHRILLSDAFEELDKIIYGRAQIKRFYFTKETKRGEIVGIAHTLEDLNKIRQELKDSNIFQDVSITLMGEIQKENIQFKIEFKL